MDKREEAKKYLKENKQSLIEQFASLEKHPSVNDPFSIFMAGSPGAGKTETSKGLINSGLIKEVFNFNCPGGVVRIDDDEIRNFFREIGYDGTNTDIFKPASNIGVEKIFDHALKNNQNLILDATFANYEKSKKNIERSLKCDRKVGIFYMYLDPVVAWNFTQIRFREEGRSISRDFFINSLFRAKENVNKIKEELGEKVELTLLERMYNKEKRAFDEKFSMNIENIDNYLKIKYNKKLLSKKLLC